MAAFARPRPLRNFEDALDVAAAALGKEHEVIVGGGGEEMLHKIVLDRLRFTGGHADDAFAAAPLRPICAHRGALDKAVVGEGDDDAFVGDQIFNGNFAFVRHNLCAAWAAVFALDLAELVLDDFQDARFPGDDVQRSLIVAMKASYSFLTFSRSSPVS